MTESGFLNVSFYKFVELADLPALQKQVRENAMSMGLKGSILLSREGINGFLCAEAAQLSKFMEWLRERPEFSDIQTKDSLSSHVPFKRMLVKIKKEIITMGRPDLTPSRFTGKRLYPLELKQWLDEKKDLVLVDTRNTYEIDQGTFRGAVDYGIETFKAFPEALQKHVDELKGKTVVMFCTGGIRCEKATALAMEYGIKDVYQLEGGILKYFEDTGGAHYQGDCFVFDGREAVDPNLTGAVDRKFKARVGRITLFSYHRCPYALRARIVLEEKRMPYRLLEEDLENPSQQLLALNPNGSVPVLLHNEVQLKESSVITQYIAEEFSHDPQLIPASAERRARMRLWTAWADQTLAPDVYTWRYESSELPAEERDRLIARLQKHLAYLQGSLQRRPFVISKEFTLADVHVFPMVHFLISDSAPIPGLEKLEKLLQWHRSILDRPAVRKALTPLRQSDQSRVTNAGVSGY